MAKAIAYRRHLPKLSSARHIGLSYQKKGIDCILVKFDLSAVTEHICKLLFHKEMILLL
jgi:hypothetical protein